MRRSAVLVAVVAAVLVGSLFAPIAVGAGDGTGDEAGGADAGTGAAGRNLTLGELNKGGSKPANAPDSVRANGKYGEFVLKWLPTGLLVQEDAQSDSWRFLEPGTVIRRNELQLWSKRAYGADKQAYVVRIAHWQRGQETITNEDGETRTRPIAENVTSYERTVTFSGGYDYATIDLKPHYDGPVRTTMCVQEPEEPNCLEEPTATRWLFTHHSSKTAAPIQTHSQGGRLAWGYGVLVLPFFATTALTLYGGRQLVKAAKAPPQISAVWWVVVAVLLALFVVAGWDWLSNTLVRAPWLISAVVGVLLGFIAVEWYGHDTYGIGFLQFQLTDGFDPTDPEAVKEALEADADMDAGLETGDPQSAPGVLKARFFVQRFARGEDGSQSAIRAGLRRFWARARGATADLEVDGNMQTRIDVEGPIQELYLLDPEDEEPLTYEPERHEIAFPNLVEYDEDGNRTIHPTPYVLGLGVLGVSWLAGDYLTGSGVLGLLVGGLAVFATRILRPVRGRMFANLAPIHYHHAVGAMLTHAAGIGSAKAWEDWFLQYTRSEAEKQADKKDLTDRRNTSQLEQLFQRYVGSDAAEPPTRSSADAEGSGDD